MQTANIGLSRRWRQHVDLVRTCHAALLAGLAALAACDYDAADIELEADAADAAVRDGSDSGRDGGRRSATDPCLNGTFDCMNVPIDMKGDFTVLVTGAVLSTEVDGHRFEARSENGYAELTLPTDRVMWVRIEADGYWPVVHAIFVPRGHTHYRGYVDLISHGLMNDYFDKVGAVLDESKGYFLAEFFVGDIYTPRNIPGASVSIATTSDPPIVNLPTDLVRSDVLIEGGSPYIHFLNVPPGPFSPRPTAPGHDCEPLSSGLTHVMSPRTTIQIGMICTPVDE